MSDFSEFECVQGIMALAWTEGPLVSTLAMRLARNLDPRLGEPVSSEDPEIKAALAKDLISSGQARAMERVREIRAVHRVLEGGGILRRVRDRFQFFESFSGQLVNVNEYFFQSVSPNLSEAVRAAMTTFN